MKTLLHKSLITAALLATVGQLAAQEPPPENCEPWQTPLIARELTPAGVVTVSNSLTDLVVSIETTSPWEIEEVRIYAGLGAPPLNGSGGPNLDAFPFVTQYQPRVFRHKEVISLEQDLYARCGENLQMAVWVQLVGKGPDDGEIRKDAFAFGPKEWPGRVWGWHFDYETCCDDCGCGPLHLSASTLQRGAPGVFQVRGARTGEIVRFVASCNDIVCNGGPSIARLGGMRLDILPNNIKFGAAVAGQDGTATLNMLLPAKAPLDLLAIQAVIPRGPDARLSVKSNAIYVQVQP